MKRSKKLSEALSYLSGNEIKENDISKDLIFDHEFAKKVFGKQNSSSIDEVAPDWKRRLQTIVTYTDEELSKFFIQLYDWYVMVDKFRELDIDYTKGYDNLVIPYYNGEMYSRYNPYKYFIPFYESITKLGFKVSYVSQRDSWKKGENSISLSNDKLGINMRLENNPFHDNWFTMNLYGGDLQSNKFGFRHGMSYDDELRDMTLNSIKEAMEYKFEEGDDKSYEEYKRAMREYKSYMLLNDVDKFDGVEYVKSIVDES
jgi:hypothetical protein